MKFSLNHNTANKTLSIPRAALQLSGLAGVSDLILHTDSGCIYLILIRCQRGSSRRWCHIQRQFAVKERKYS